MNSLKNDPPIHSLLFYSNLNLFLSFPICQINMLLMLHDSILHNSTPEAMQLETGF